MSKATLTFDLNETEERMKFTRTMRATDAYIALHEMAEKIFRPARKHGYENDIESLIGEDSECREVISKLESMFYQILLDNKIDLDDLE